MRYWSASYRELIAGVLILIGCCQFLNADRVNANPPSANCDCSQLPPVEALSECTTQSMQFMHSGPRRERTLSLERIFLSHTAHKPVLQGFRPAWNNDGLNEGELEGRVSLNWLVQHTDGSLSRYAVTTLCHYADNNRFFGDKSLSPQQRSWEKRVNQALWQLCFQRSCIPESSLFTLGSQAYLGYWVQTRPRPDEAQFAYYGPAAQIAQSGGLRVMEKGDLIAFVSLQKDKEPSVKSCCSTRRDSEQLLQDIAGVFKTASLQIPESFPQSKIDLAVRMRAVDTDPSVIHTATHDTQGRVLTAPKPVTIHEGDKNTPPVHTSGGVFGIEMGGPETTQRHLRKFNELYAQTKNLFKNKKLSADEARKAIPQLKDEEVILLQDVMTEGKLDSSLVYKPMHHLLVELYPLVRNNEAALLTDYSTSLIPSIYGQHGLVKEQVEMERWIIGQTRISPGQRQRLMLELHTNLASHVYEAKARGTVAYLNACKFVHDYINAWTPDESAGILELGSDFRRLDDQCKSALKGH